jgi:hypothetical protein
MAEVESQSIITAYSTFVKVDLKPCFKITYHPVEQAYINQEDQDHTHPVGSCRILYAAL